MRPSTQLIILPALAVMLTACGPSKAPTPKAPHRTSLIAKLDSIAHDFLAQGKTMGFSIAILKDDDTLYNKGFGFMDTLRTKETNTATVFNLASISKLIGSAITLKLAEEGVLSLDQTLGELLPEFPQREQAKAIKLRHLLSMTSGLQEYAPEIDSMYLATGRAPTKKDLLRFFARQQLAFSPGESYRYCNSGYVLLPFILERATGETYEDLIERIINQPTGLDIRLMADRVHDPNLTHFFELAGDQLKPRAPWTWLRGDGGLTASAMELAHLPPLLMRGAIIDTSSLRQLIAPTRLKGGLRPDYGLGVARGNFEGHRLWGHSGADKSYWSMMYYFPDDKMTIVTLVNTNDTPYDAKELYERVALAVFDQAVPDYTGSEVETYDRNSYAGEYYRSGDAPSRTITIVWHEADDHLYYTFAGKVEEGEKMHHLGNDEFWVEKWPTDRVKFVRNPENQVVALKEYYSGYFSQWRVKVD